MSDKSGSSRSRSSRSSRSRNNSRSRNKSRSRSSKGKSRNKSDDDTDSYCTYSWHVGLICAIIIFIVFMLFHTPNVVCWLEHEIPNQCVRTICVGLILGVLVFLVVGLYHHLTDPVKDNTTQKTFYRHFAPAIIDLS